MKRGVALHIVPTSLKFLRGFLSCQHTVVIANPKTDAIATLTFLSTSIAVGLSISVILGS